MTFSFLFNYQPTTGGEALWKFKEYLVSQGWSVARSGDGSGGNYSASGDVHSPGGSYSGTLDLANSWLELKQPVAASPRRSFMFQVPNTTGTAWRIWYSSNGVGFKWSYSGTGDSISLVSGSTYRLTDAGAAFVAGDVGSTIKITGATSAGNNGEFVITAQTATTVDFTNASGVVEAYTGTWYVDTSNRTGTGLTATLRGIAVDEQGITNTPALSNQWLPSAATYRMEVISGDSSEGFSFFWGCRRLNQMTYASVLSLDVLSSPNGSDADPAIIGVSWQSGTAFATTAAATLMNNTSSSQTTGCSRGWYKKGLAGEAFVAYPHVFWGSWEGAGAILPFNNDRQSQQPDYSYQDFPIWYWRGSATHATERGYKGISRLYRSAQPRLGSLRLNEGRTRMGMGIVSIPWDGTTLPLYY